MHYLVWRGGNIQYLAPLFALLPFCLVDIAVLVNFSYPVKKRAIETNGIGEANTFCIDVRLCLAKCEAGSNILAVHTSCPDLNFFRVQVIAQVVIEVVAIHIKQGVARRHFLIDIH